VKYDYTLKDLFKDIPSGLLQLLTGFRDGKFLDIQFPDIKYRQPDLLLELPDKTIFHLEFQSAYDPTMLLRMLEYQFLIYQQHGKEAKQLLLYVGEEPVKFENKINLAHLQYSYTVQDISDIDCKLLLESDKPEDIVLAILCKTDDPKRTIRRILGKLSALPEKTRKDYIIKLLNLSHLRKLDFLINEEVKKMPITMDIQESFLFKQGRAQGLSEGLAEGHTEGRAEGKQETKREDILNLYTKLNLTSAKIAEVLNVDITFVVSTLEEAGLLKHN
jgi:predicted transposase YdaD